MKFRSVEPNVELHPRFARIVLFVFSVTHDAWRNADVTTKMRSDVIGFAVQKEINMMSHFYKQPVIIEWSAVGF